VSSGTLLWRNPIGGNPHTIINVLVKDQIERFAEEASTSILGFFEQCSEPLHRLRGEREAAQADTTPERPRE
jgi:hypothetical protein